MESKIPLFALKLFCRALCLSQKTDWRTTAIGLSWPAFAQTASSVTPPGRVGQVTNISGNVSYDGAGSNNQWVAATANYPVTEGDSLFTQNGAEATLVLDSSRLTLGANTELQVTALDNANFTATESQGEVFLNVTGLQPGQNFILNTPRGGVNISQDGAYDIAAGDANDPTTVGVLTGAASIGQLQVPAGQEASLSGTDQTTAQLGPIQHDAFIDHVLAEMAPPPPPYAPPVVTQMTGVSELSNYGTWAQNPQYGAVWYPDVAPGWAPYRVGHWAFIAPWGWTWVDSAPWGFAPFHYGRWIQDAGRWCWVPVGAYAAGGYGPGYQPVYAPALVGFFGLGAGVAVTAAILSSGSVGWVPLAPGEAYYPSYHVDPAYMHRINRWDVHDYQRISAHPPENIAIYANRHAATYIPSAAMARGEPVAHFGHAVPESMFAQARPVTGDFNHALRPDFVPHVAAAPHPTPFAQRRDVPPAVISRTPMQPGTLHPSAEVHFPGSNGGVREPGMTVPPHAQPEQPVHPYAQPGYHPQEPGQPFHPAQPAPQVFQPHEAAPPVRPYAQPGYHPQEPGQPFHPSQPSPQVFQPHEAAPPAYRPAEPARPPEPSFHPNAQPPYHPPMPAQPFHPPQPQVHAPSPEVYRPHEAAPPMYRPAEPARPPEQPQFHPQSFRPPAPAAHPPAPREHPPAGRLDDHRPQ